MIQEIVTILFVLIPIVWIILKEKKTARQAIADLIPPKQELKKEIIGSFALFGALFLGFIIIVAGLSVFEASTGLAVNDLDKVNDVIDAEITYNLGLFLFTLIVVVFIEEFFFRAFLIPRAGMIPATLIFTFFHYGYGSIAEIIGVFFLGLILAYWFKKKKSIIQNYFGHLFYNCLALVFYFFI